MRYLSALEPNIHTHNRDVPWTVRHFLRPHVITRQRTVCIKRHHTSTGTQEWVCR